MDSSGAHSCTVVVYSMEFIASKAKHSGGRGEKKAPSRAMQEYN